MISPYKDSSAPTCIICKTTPFNGDHGGLMIKTKLICSLCETKIILTPLDDQYYLNFKEELKSIWYNC